MICVRRMRKLHASPDEHTLMTPSIDNKVNSFEHTLKSVRPARCQVTKLLISVASKYLFVLHTWHATLIMRGKPAFFPISTWDFQVVHVPRGKEKMTHSSSSFPRSPVRQKSFGRKALLPSHPTVGFAVVGLTNNVPVRLSTSGVELPVSLIPLRAYVF